MFTSLDATNLTPMSVRLGQYYFTAYHSTQQFCVDICKQHSKEADIVDVDSGSGKSKGPRGYIRAQTLTLSNQIRRLHFKFTPWKLPGQASSM